MGEFSQRERVLGGGTDIMVEQEAHLTDNVLLSLLNDEIVLDSDAEAHLRHCSRCQARLQEMMELHASLSKLLYRATCPAPETLEDYWAGRLPAAEEKVVRSHVNRCPFCQDELRTLQARSGNAPEEWVSFATDSVPLIRATLIQTVTLPATWAIRGDTDRAQSWLYKSDRYDVLLTLEKNSEPAGNYLLAVQVMPQGKAGVVEGKVYLYKQRRVVNIISLNSAGFCVLPVVGNGVYQLTVHLQEVAIGGISITVEKPPL